MENWGIITYREINLLYDEKTTPYYVKQNINVMIHHELAHMWFGNIVSPEWWNDLWLSEGMRYFIELFQVNYFIVKLLFLKDLRHIWNIKCQIQRLLTLYFILFN